MLIGCLGQADRGLERFDLAEEQSPSPIRVGPVLEQVSGCRSDTGSAVLSPLVNSATVNWIIPIAAFVGAGIMGAYPARRTKKVDSVELDDPVDNA